MSLFPFKCTYFLKIQTVYIQYADVRSPSQVLLQFKRKQNQKKLWWFNWVEFIRKKTTLLRQEVRFFAPALSTKTKLRVRNKLNFLVCLVRRKWSTGPQDSEPWFSVSHRQPCWTAGNWPGPIIAQMLFRFQNNSQTIKRRRRAARGRQAVVWTTLFCKNMEPLEQRFACSAVLGPRLCGVLKLPQSTSLPAIQTFLFSSWLADDSLCKRAPP